MKFQIKQNKELRNKNYYRIINRKFQNYIKNPIGSLYLYGLPINKLPKNLKYIDGYLDIGSTNISELPDDIIIRGSLYITKTNISELPKNLKYIDDNLGISYTKITELPRGLEIKGDLDIECTNISELPDDIIIEGNLYCHNTPLSDKYSNEELIKKYNIKGNIYDT